MDQIIPILGLLCAVALPFAGAIFIGFFLLKSRHAERMELIKQGIIPNSQVRTAPSRYRALRTACMLIGAGLGTIIGYLMSCLNLCDSDYILAYTILFLGIGFLVFFLYTRGKTMNENEE